MRLHARTCKHADLLAISNSTFSMAAAMLNEDARIPAPGARSALSRTVRSLGCGCLDRKILDRLVLLAEAAPARPPSV